MFVKKKKEDDDRKSLIELEDDEDFGLYQKVRNEMSNCLEQSLVGKVVMQDMMDVST